MKSAQSALEYLIVYGWVFIIIVIIGSALYYLGVFNPSGDLAGLTEQSFQTDEVGVLDHQLLSNGVWILKLHPRGYNVDITRVVINGKNFYFNEYMPNGKSELFTGNLGITGVLGDTYQYDMYIYYTKKVSGLTHVAAGVFAGVIEGDYDYSALTQTPTPQTPGSYYQTSYADFSQGIASNTNYEIVPGSVVLNLESNWFSEYYDYRLPVIITEKSGRDLVNHPFYVTLDTASLISDGKLNSDASDLKLVINGVETPYQVENGTLNTPDTKVWFLLNLSANNARSVYFYYGNPSALKTSYSTDLTYTTGSDGHFENDKIYASVGNNNNPSYYGFDSVYEKRIGTDLVNYYSYFFNRDNNQAHSVTATDSGPVYVELTMTGIGNEKNTERLVYRLYSQNNIIRWMVNNTIIPDYSAWLGWDNTEISTFESNSNTHSITGAVSNYTFNNLTYSYVRLINPSTNYGIAMFSPLKLSAARVSGGTNSLIEERMGLYNNTDSFIEYFDYYIGALTVSECNDFSIISTNPPVFITSAEEELYLTNGIFTSKAYDTGYNNPDYKTLTLWKWNDSNSNVKVRMRTGDTEAEVNIAPWYGPSSMTDYYENTRSINSIHDGDRWVQYRVYLTTTNKLITPRFEAINISFAG